MGKLMVIVLLALFASACSVKFEVGYHGETGRDDRTMTAKKG